MNTRRTFFLVRIFIALIFTGFVLKANLSKANCTVNASFTSPTSAVNLNVPVVFTNTSTNGLTYKWFIDDVLVGTLNDLTYIFTIQNVHKVKLVASDGSCSDTSTLFLIQTGCEKKRNTDKWYFGEGAAVDFSSGIPTAVSGCAMMQREGVASIANDAGNLLFYTEGSTVWDANNTVMPNGTSLLGSWLSAQSSIIVPAPGVANQYYIFTVHNWTDGTSEFAYSIIDMTLRAGLGDIIPAKKNIVIQNNIYERVTTVRHKNCRDIWIISHERNNNRYVSYLLTPSGVSATAVTTDIGSVSIGPNRFGGLRSSHNGRKMCSTLGGSGAYPAVELLDFDNATGTLSGLVTLATAGQFNGAYSSEFSANDRVLYVCSYSNLFIRQYDLYAGSEAAMQQSMINISSDFNTTKAALQMGPDGKIYVSEDYEKALGVIEQPNVLGMGCGYQTAAVPVTGFCRLGLPNFMPSLFGDALSIEGPSKLCSNTEAVYAAFSSFCTTGLRWEISGPGSIEEIYPGDSIRVKFSEPGGICQLRAYTQGPCGEVQAELLITVNPSPTAGLPADTAICAGASVLLTGNPGMTSYLWNTGHTTPSRLIGIPGKYWLTVTNANGCKGTDTVEVSTETNAISVNLGNDTSLCPGKSMVLDPKKNNVNYLWQDGSTGATYAVQSPGTYWVRIENSCLASAADTIIVSQFATPIVSLGNDTLLCRDQSLLLHATAGFASYRWQDGSNQTGFTVKVDGQYSVLVTDANGCQAADTVSVGFKPVDFTSVFPNKNKVHCFDKGPITLEAENGVSFVWQQNGSTAPVFIASEPGRYNIIATDQYGCKWSDQITVTDRCEPELYLPGAFTPNKDGNNDQLEIFGRHFTNFKITIFNRWGEIIFISTDRSIQWDGNYRGQEMPIGTYPWIVHYESQYEGDPIPDDLKGSVTLIR